jgi:diguanylate cyclase
MVGRCGGEEFGVLLPRCSLREGRLVAEEVREAVAATRWECKVDGKPGVLSATVSIGLVQRRADEPAEQILPRVFGALDAAKRGGRDRVVAQA